MADKKLNHQVLKNTLPYFVKLDIKKYSYYIYVHISMCVCVCMYVCVCVCVCVCIYIYTEVILSINI